jgi:hypothetical protein
MVLHSDFGHAREPTFCGEVRGGQSSFCSNRSHAPAADAVQVGTDEAKDLQQRRAAEVIGSFCEEHPSCRVRPTRSELSDLWERCKNFKSQWITSALCDQLAGALNSHAWQPRLRALAIIENFYEDDCSRPSAQAAVLKANDLVRYLASDVPECSELACRVLLLGQLAEVLPSSQAVRVANEGGLISFVAETRGEDVLQDNASLHGVNMPDLLDPIDHTSDKVHAGEANIVADLISLVEEAPRASIETFAFEGREKYMNRRSSSLPLDLDFSAPHAPAQAKQTACRTPEVFSIANGECSSDNPELCSMYKFAPRHVPDIPLLSCKTERGCGFLASRPDPFASFAAHAYLQCVAP